MTRARDATQGTLCHREPEREGQDATARSTAAEHGLDAEQARLVVTTRGFRERKAWRALKSALAGAWLEGSRFRGVLLVEAEGDPLVLGERVVRDCREAVGHVTPVLKEVETDTTAIRDAAVEVAVAHVAAGRSFCFRIHRRGWKLPGKDAAALEGEIGGAVFDALARRHGVRPTVDLEHPDVAVVAEVLGRRTAVGIVPKAWRETGAQERVTPAST